MAEDGVLFYLGRDGVGWGGGHGVGGKESPDVGVFLVSLSRTEQLN